MSNPRHMAFAVPGDITTVTGGYLYDRRLGEALTAAGVTLCALRLGDSFPHPTGADMDDALAQLAALPPDCPALVDGLAYGALDPARLGAVRAPLVALVHHPLALEPGLDAGMARRMAAREQANLALARHIVVTSPHIAQLLASEYGVDRARISVAQPGFIAPVQAARAPDAPPLILSVGLLARRKGHDILLRALAEIADLDWQAVIVGRAHEAATARARRAQRDGCGLAGRVRIAGEIPQAALDELYRRATVFALATRYEGYGIVFAEAMGHGLPIVTTRAGAVPETVPPEAGLLVPPEDAHALAGALRRMLGDAPLHESCARAARAAATRLPGWPESAAVVAAALFGATTGGGAPRNGATQTNG